MGAFSKFAATVAALTILAACTGERPQANNLAAVDTCDT